MIPAQPIDPTDVVRSWSVNLTRGLHLFRYNGSDVQAPPLVRIICEPPFNNTVMHPDLAQSILRRPGCALIIRAISDSKVTVEVVATDQQSVEAEILVEELEF
jgi:hypothetical protein